MEQTIRIDRKAFEDLRDIKDEFDAIIESIELMNDREFMESYEKAKEEIKNRDFIDWNK
jgi:hypothetical protein